MLIIKIMQVKIDFYYVNIIRSSLTQYVVFCFSMILLLVVVVYSRQYLRRGQQRYNQFTQDT